MKLTLLRSAGIYGIANVLSAAVPFLLLPVLTRALSPSEYGEVIVFYMLVAVCSAVAGLSLHGAVGVRWMAPSKGDPRSYTASALLLVLLSTALAAVLSAIAAPLFGIGLVPRLCAFAALVAGTNVIQGMRFAVWQSREQPLRAAMLQVCAATLNFGLSLTAVLVLHLKAEGRIYGATLAGVMVCCSSIYSLLRDGSVTRVSPSDSTALLRFGVPLMPHVLGGALLTNADRFAVSARLGASALGIYGTASQLGMIINVLSDAAAKAFTPLMYRMLGQDTLQSRLRLVAVIYLTVPVWLGVALVVWASLVTLGPPLLGEPYREAINLSIWFLIGGAIGGVYLNISALLFFAGKTEWVSVATLSASAVALLVATTAVSALGLVGGAIAYIVAQLALLLVAWLVAVRVMPNPLPWSHPMLALQVLFRRRGAAS